MNGGGEPCRAIAMLRLLLDGCRLEVVVFVGEACRRLSVGGKCAAAAGRYRYGSMVDADFASE